MEKKKRKRLLYLLMVSLMTWFVVRFDVDFFSSEYFVFLIGICLVAVVGGWCGEAEYQEDE